MTEQLPPMFDQILDTKRVKRWYQRKIHVDDYLEYLDTLVSLGQMQKVKAIMLKLRVQETAALARQHQKTHSFYLKDSLGKTVGAIRCHPDGEIDIGKVGQHH